MSHLFLTVVYSEDFKKTTTYITTHSHKVQRKTRKNILSKTLSVRPYTSSTRKNQEYTAKAISALNLKRGEGNSYYTKGCLIQRLNQIFRLQYELRMFSVTSDKRKHRYGFYCNEYYFHREIPKKQQDKNFKEINQLVLQHLTLKK